MPTAKYKLMYTHFVNVLICKRKFFRLMSAQTYSHRCRHQTKLPICIVELFSQSFYYYCLHLDLSIFFFTKQKLLSGTDRMPGKVLVYKQSTQSRHAAAVNIARVFLIAKILHAIHVFSSLTRFKWLITCVPPSFTIFFFRLIHFLKI